MAPRNAQPLILASASPARQKMLQNAGLDFRVWPANLDEERLTAELIKKNYAAKKIAETLAQQKALLVSSHDPHALIIGADSVLEYDGMLMGKAAGPDDARTKLKALNGKSHRLISAVSVVWDHEILWTYSDEAVLTMPKHEPAFLDEYCARVEPAVLTHSVGAYHLEGLGSWLFSSVKGDYFTVLGLPLLPLLQYLKNHQDIRP